MSEKTLGQVAFDGAVTVADPECVVDVVSPAHWEAAGQAVARVVEERLREEFRESLAGNLRNCELQVEERVKAEFRQLVESAARVMSDVAGLQRAIVTKDAALQFPARYFRAAEALYRRVASAYDMHGRIGDGGEKLRVADAYAEMAAQCEAALAGVTVPAESAPSPWTREPPTEPGWYWHWRDGGQCPLLVVLDYRDGLPPAAMGGHWQGPVKPCGVPPEMPKASGP